MRSSGRRPAGHMHVHGRADDGWTRLLKMVRPLTDGHRCLDPLYHPHILGLDRSMRNSLSGLLRLLAVFALVALARASTDGGEALRHDLAAPAAATESSSPLQTVRRGQSARGRLPLTDCDWHL